MGFGKFLKHAINPIKQIKTAVTSSKKLLKGDVKGAFKGAAKSSLGLGSKGSKGSKGSISANAQAATRAADNTKASLQDIS